jgi:hypothetical protein
LEKIVRVMLREKMKPEKGRLSFEDKKINICFEIGSNWGPHLLVGQGE